MKSKEANPALTHKQRNTPRIKSHRFHKTASSFSGKLHFGIHSSFYPIRLSEFLWFVHGPGVPLG